MPVWHNRVAPHFGTAPELLIAVADGDRVLCTGVLPCQKLVLSTKRFRLVSLGVDTLICGGIEESTRMWLERRGIQVIANQNGEAEEVLQNVLTARPGSL